MMQHARVWPEPEMPQPAQKAVLSLENQTSFC